MPPPVINSTTDVKPIMAKQPAPGSSSSVSSTLNSSSSSSRSSLPSSHRDSDLLVRLKWGNTLPDIPFDPKFLVYPFDPDRFTKYKATSLEKEYKHELLTEHDLGVKIDLINPDAYVTPEGAVLEMEDERLIEDDSASHTHPHGISEKRSRQHSKVVPWLKKTEYISNEFNRYGASSENNETKVGYNVQKKFKEDKEKIICMDREGQVLAINRTFEEVKKPITHHHSRKGVTALEVLPVFPDFDFWKMPFAQVSFDAEPVQRVAVDGVVVEDRDACENIMKEAMIRGVEDASGDQFVAYFLPAEETLEKRKRDVEAEVEYNEDEEYEYKQTRDYTWAVKNKSNRGYDQNYFFVTRNNAVYYNELETRVKLTKRRSKTGPTAKSRLLVKHRPLTESEMKAQTMREIQLKPNIEEDDQEIEIDINRLNPDNRADEEEEEEESQPNVSQEKKRKASQSDSDSDEESESSSGSESASDSGSASDEDEKKKKAKKDAEEIFGSDDDDDD